MHVLQVIPSVSPYYGGTSEVFFHICKTLRKLGVEVSIASTDAKGPESAEITASIPAGIKAHIFKRDFSEAWKYSGQFGGWLRANVKQFDLVHCHSVWSYLPSKAAAVAINQKVPHFVSPHGMLSPYTFSRKPLLKKVFWWASERTMVRNASGFFASSRAEAAEIQTLNAKAPVCTLPHGLPEEAFATKPDPDFLRKQIHLDASVPILLFFSRVHPKKGLLDLLLPAFSRLREKAVLVIAGGEDPHSPGHMKEVRAYVSENGLEKKVIFVGYVDPADRWRYFDSADLFLLPSQAENFGMVVVEAMARGTPVIISEQVQAAEIVKQHSGGLVLPRNTEAWTQAIDRALATQPLAKPSYHGSWDSIGSQMIGFYEKCLLSKNVEKNTI